MLYLRIFRPVKVSNILIWVGIGTIVLFYIICIITTSVFCKLSQWSNTTNAAEFMAVQIQSKCNQPQLNLSAVQGVFSTASDIYVFIIPTMLVWGLQLPLQRRIGICAIFLIGLLFGSPFLYPRIIRGLMCFRATGCSIATVYSRFRQRTSADFSWDSSLNMILGYDYKATNLSQWCLCS